METERIPTNLKHCDADDIKSGGPKVDSGRRDVLKKIVKWERKRNYISCGMLCLVDVTHVPLCEMKRHPEPPSQLSPRLFSRPHSDRGTS